eukprot:m.306413 g.306413  ORF g.306413 m.306413 type:complete len:57 (-) comp19622_c0_seq5:83-253(-)
MRKTARFRSCTRQGPSSCAFSSAAALTSPLSSAEYRRMAAATQFTPRTCIPTLATR